MDYNWLMEFMKTYSASKPVEQQSFISLSLEEETPKQMTWEVKVLQLQSPDGDSIEIKSNNGGGQPENLLDFVNILQEELVRAGVLPADFDFEAHKKLVPMQPGDVPTTYADATVLERDFGFTPKITLREGLRKFAEWYKSYYCSDV